MIRETSILGNDRCIMRLFYHLFFCSIILAFSLFRLWRRTILSNYSTTLITGTKNGKLFQVGRAADTLRHRKRELLSLDVIERRACWRNINGRSYGYRYSAQFHHTCGPFTTESIEKALHFIVFIIAGTSKSISCAIRRPRLA